jgi:prefoldin alpha subunit
MSAVSVSNEREIQPMQLSLEQLNTLKVQHEQELQELARQMESLIGAKSRFQNARATLDEISVCPSGGVILIPLNSSLYVPGKILEPNKVSFKTITTKFGHLDVLQYIL